MRNSFSLEAHTCAELCKTKIRTVWNSKLKHASTGASGSVPEETDGMWGSDNLRMVSKAVGETRGRHSVAVLKLECASGCPGGLVKTQTAGPHPQSM